MRTVAVLGASYGGFHAARVLAQGVPPGWRVVLIDRNSHVNHLYVFPRYSVLPGHEQKAFIPPTHVFGPPSPSSPSYPSATKVFPSPNQDHVFLNAVVTLLSPHFVVLNRSFPEYGVMEDRRLEFDYLVYALGSVMPGVIDLWREDDEFSIESTDTSYSAELTLVEAKETKRPEAPNNILSDESTKREENHNDTKSTQVVHTMERGTKVFGMSFLQRMQKRIKRASSVLVVGGGALGIQFASDIASLYPDKRVTLLHSRERLLPRFDNELGETVLSTLHELGVNVILGERLDLESVKPDTDGRSAEDDKRVARTLSGREIPAELTLLCTGQTPNTHLLASLMPEAIVTFGDSKVMIKVARTLQVGVLREEEAEAELGVTVPYPHLFAIGDAADAFGAINAGHTAYNQGEVAARNIIRLIRASSSDSKSFSTLSHFAVASSQEGVVVKEDDQELEEYKPGLPGIKVSMGMTDSAYQINGQIGTKSNCAKDLDAAYMWHAFGLKDVDERGMFQ